MIAMASVNAIMFAGVSIVVLVGVLAMSMGMVAGK